MPLPIRLSFRLVQLALMSAIVVLFCVASAAASDRSIILAQLNIEVGGVKIGKDKCREKSDVKCLEDREREKEHRNKREKLRQLETGIGIVIEGGKGAAKKKKVQKKDSGVVTKKKKEPPTAVSTKKDKKKVAKKPEAVPKERPAFVPPEFPIMVAEDCEDCDELWDSILWYEYIISTDARKLFDRRQDIEDRKAEIDDLRSKLPKANSIDRVFYTKEIARHEQYIEAVNKLNDEFAELIKEEWIILRERMDQYAECADRYCPKLVKETPVEPVAPSTPALSEPPPGTAASSDTATSGSGYGLGPSLKLEYKFDGKSIDYGTTIYNPTAPPLPLSRPPEDQDLKICGPDITEAVIKTLKKMRADYKANPDKQAAACRSLIDPRTGGYAWDIVGLNPAVAVPQAGKDEAGKDREPYTYEKKYDAWVQRDGKGDIIGWKQPWFTGESPMCAIPRNDPVCAPTVEFFGICEHAQVVNYIQWRFMLGLCGGGYPYVGPLLHKAWNTIQYGGSAPKEQQANMSKVAKKILDKLENDESETDFSDIKSALVELDAGVSKDIRQCELKCPIKIDREFSYIWVGLKSGRPYETVRLDRDLDAMKNDGLDKLKAKAEAAGYTRDAMRPGAVLDKILKSLGLN